MGADSAIDTARDLLAELRQAFPEDLTKAAKDDRVARKLGWPLPSGARRVRAIRAGTAGPRVILEFFKAVASQQAGTVRVTSKQLDTGAVLARLDRLEADLAEIRKMVADA